MPSGSTSLAAQRTLARLTNHPKAKGGKNGIEARHTRSLVALTTSSPRRTALPALGPRLRANRASAVGAQSGAAAAAADADPTTPAVTAADSLLVLPPIDALNLSRDAMDELEASGKEAPVLRHGSFIKPPKSEHVHRLDVQRTKKGFTAMLEQEGRLARRLEHFNASAPMRQTLSKSKSSFAILQGTDLRALRRVHEDRGERRYYMRLMPEEARHQLAAECGTGRTRDGVAPWHPVCHPSHSKLNQTTAEDLLLQQKGVLDPSVPVDAELVDVGQQVALMRRGLTEQQAFKQLLQLELRRRRERNTEVVPEEEEDEERAAILVALSDGKQLTERRIIDVFRRLDSDAVGSFGIESLTQLLHERGVDVEEGREVIADVFDELDADGDGRVGYSDLCRLLRVGRRMRLAPSLREGAFGELEVEPKNRHKLRTHVDERRMVRRLRSRSPRAQLRSPPTDAARTRALLLLCPRPRASRSRAPS